MIALLQRSFKTSCERLYAVHVEFLHVKPGKGAAFVRSKIKNYLTGSIQDKTFRAGESLQAAMVERKDSQFSYMDGDDVRPSAQTCDSSLMALI